MIKSTTRFITLAALFLIPIFPLIVANSYFFPFITGKAFYFRILTEIAFLSWVVLAFIDARYRPRFNSMTVTVTLFALIALVADLLGVNPIRSFWSNFERMEGWITIAHLWMFYMTITSMFGPRINGPEESRRWWHRWMNSWIGVGIVVAIYAIVQLTGHAEIHQGSRIDASLGNAAYLAVYLLMNVGMTVYLFLDTRRRGQSAGFLQYFYGVLAVVFAYLLFETATRGTILGLGGGIMLALFLYAILARGESKKSRWAAGGFIIAILLVGLVFWLNRDSKFVQNYEALRRMATISINDVTTQARGYIWPMAIKGFSERPILGWGQENFNYIFNANYNPKMWTQEQWFDRAHSVYLDWLVASGLVGFLAYISLYVLAFVIVWRSGMKVSEKAAMTGFIAAYAVHNIFVFDNLASYVGFFAVLGFVGSALTSMHAKDGEVKHSYVIGGEKIINSDVAEYVVLPACIVLFIVGIYFLNIRVVKANTSLIAALQSCQQGATADANLFEKVFSMNVYVADQETREQLVACSGSVLQSNAAPGPTKQAFLQEATKAIKDQIASTPKDARMYVLGGQFFANLGQANEALDTLQKAHALTPGKQTVDFALANVYINIGQTEKALALLKEAYDGDPTYPAAKTGYAYGLIIVGREAEAHKLFGNDPAIFATEQAAQIYASLKKFDQALAIYRTLAASSTDINLLARYAQVQFQTGQVYGAVETLRRIEKDHPEYKDQVESTIKTILKQ